MTDSELKAFQDYLLEMAREDLEHLRKNLDDTAWMREYITDENRRTSMETLPKEMIDSEFKAHLQKRLNELNRIKQEYIRLKRLEMFEAEYGPSMERYERILKEKTNDSEIKRN